MDKNHKQKMEEEIKEKRPYPKRVYKDEAELTAIVCLRDCAGLSMIAITRLLGHSDSSKRNIEWVYNKNKLFFKCNQVLEMEKKIKK